MNTFSITRLSVLAIALILNSGCGSTRLAQSYQPDDQLQTLLSKYEVGPLNGIQCQGQKAIIIDCERLSSELGAMSMTYPHHQKIGLTAAIVYQQIDKNIDSQLILDRLLSMQQPLSGAVVLRSQLAMQAGNINHARSILMQQLQIEPSHPELHSNLAATYYLEGRYEKAESVITTADRLGAPLWKTSYHLGLVHEAQEHWAQACEYYADTLAYQASHKQSLSRLLYLSDHPDCRVPFSRF